MIHVDSTIPWPPNIEAVNDNPFLFAPPHTIFALGACPSIEQNTPHIMKMATVRRALLGMKIKD